MGASGGSVFVCEGVGVEVDFRGGEVTVVLVEEGGKSVLFSPYGSALIAKLARNAGSKVEGTLSKRRESMSS